MALSESGTTELSGTDTPAELTSVKLADEKSATVYRAVNGTTRCYARIGDISSGSLVVGSAQEIDTNGDYGGDIDRLSDSLVLFAYRDGDDSNKGKARTLSVSGSTVTEGSAAEFESNGLTAASQIRLATVSVTLGLVGYRSAPGTTHNLCRLTVSGGTVTPGTPANHSEAGVPIAAIAADASTVFYVYIQGGTGDIACQLIDISSGISEGTPDTVPSVTSTGVVQIPRLMAAKLDTDKFIVVFPRSATPNKLSAVVVNTSGTGIDSFGAVLDIVSDDDAKDICVSAISSSQVLVLYRDGSNNSIVETLSIDGSDNITQDGDDITLTQGFAEGTSIPIVVDTKAIATWGNTNTNNGYMAMISGVPSGDSTPTGTAAQFYFGQGSLALKFDLPWSGVNPKSLTLDQSLGVAVMGTNAPANEPVIYSQHPYPTGTNTSLGFPTGTAISALRWV